MKLKFLSLSALLLMMNLICGCLANAEENLPSQKKFCRAD